MQALPFLRLSLGVLFLHTGVAKNLEHPSVSIFFSPTDLDKLNSLHSGNDQSQTDLDAVAQKKDILSLEGIIYFGPDKWTVFINGQPTTPSDNPYHITKVEEGSVSIKTKRGKSVVLRSGQTLNRETGQVIAVQYDPVPEKEEEQPSFTSFEPQSAMEPSLPSKPALPSQPMMADTPLLSPQPPQDLKNLP